MLTKSEEMNTRLKKLQISMANLEKELSNLNQKRVGLETTDKNENTNKDTFYSVVRPGSM